MNMSLMSTVKPARSFAFKRISQYVFHACDKSRLAVRLWTTHFALFFSAPVSRKLPAARGRACWWSWRW